MRVLLTAVQTARVPAAVAAIPAPAGSGTAQTRPLRPMRCLVRPSGPRATSAERRVPTGRTTNGARADDNAGATVRASAEPGRRRPVTLLGRTGSIRVPAGLIPRAGVLTLRLPPARRGPHSHPLRPDSGGSSGRRVNQLGVVTPQLGDDVFELTAADGVLEHREHSGNGNGGLGLVEPRPFRDPAGELGHAGTLGLLLRGQQVLLQCLGKLGTQILRLATAEPFGQNAENRVRGGFGLLPRQAGAIAHLGDEPVVPHAHRLLLPRFGS